MKFSLIYPTKDRPIFIEMALRFLQYQKYSNFEIIIGDNYSDKGFSCEQICNKFNLKNILYVKPPRSLNMVENWNFLLKYASGDYISYFTDKMFLLPGTLQFAKDAIDKKPVDIVNWVDDKYTGSAFPDYFGRGVYKNEFTGLSKNISFEYYDPKVELKLKIEGEVSRNEQAASQYARGKICFGAFKKELITKIMDKLGGVFFNLSPDYTSMISGLVYAESALQLGRSGIVHINTDISSGGGASVSDLRMLGHLKTLGNLDSFLSKMLVPGLYSSSHNCVSYDYIMMGKMLGIDIKINRANWLVYIAEDLDCEGRIWSSCETENHQKKLLNDFISNELTDKERAYFFQKLNLRKKQRQLREKTTRSWNTRIKNCIRHLFPKKILSYINKSKINPYVDLNKLTDILPTGSQL